MTFVKIALWGGLILLILPSNSEQRVAIYNNVQKTLADLGGFCDRNPDVCDNVTAAFQGIGNKLSATASTIEYMLYEVGIGVDRSQLQQPIVDIDATDSPETTSSFIVQDTLTARDRRPEWRGP